MTAKDELDPPGLLRVCVLAAVAGAAVGLIGGAFRWCLERADLWRVELLGWAQNASPGAILVPVAVTAAGAAVARWLVTFAPDAAGSGVQEVEGVWDGEMLPPKLRVLPIKFVGGVLAIGSGMVLGREGPTVQMGSSVGAKVGRRLRLPAIDRKILQVSLAGAGLAVAFNAPIGGALFVFEEVTRSFRPRLMMTTLIGCAVSVGCSRIILGDRPDFLVRTPDTPPLTQLWVFVGFGLLMGVVGAAYNRMVMGALHVTDRMPKVGPVPRAALIGAVVGALLLFDPLAVGGGDVLSQRLLGGEQIALTVVFGYLVVRFLTGPLSYAAGVPGGLFAPLLAVGALCGAAATPIAIGIVPSFDVEGAPLVVVGMAALFAAIVRSPLTGVVLVLEMTAATTLTVPMLAAAFAATLAATLVRSEPVYDTLKARSIRQLASDR